MNMNKALQNLYHAVSGSTTTKVNISKLLVDIHYAITGKESENKNNWSKIINSMADNWPEGGGGSSDFSTAEVTLNVTPPEGVTFNKELVSAAIGYHSTVYEDDYYSNWYLGATNHKATILLYNGVGYIDGIECRTEDGNYWPILSSATVSGDIAWDADIGEVGALVVTGNGTITISEWPD